jgi:NAD(P)-dependent dehydrogenase (short-subunit alcohol dehydrogenase family)
MLSAMTETVDRTRPLSERVALVTGAGRGIGRAVASTLAARGYRVMAVSRTLAELRTLTDEAGVEYLVESVATGEGWIIQHRLLSCLGFQMC